MARTGEEAALVAMDFFHETPGPADAGLFRFAVTHGGAAFLDLAELRETGMEVGYARLEAVFDTAYPKWLNKISSK